MAHGVESPFGSHPEVDDVLRVHMGGVAPTVSTAQEVVPITMSPMSKGVSGIFRPATAPAMNSVRMTS